MLQGTWTSWSATAHVQLLHVWEKASRLELACHLALSVCKVMGRYMTCRTHNKGKLLEAASNAHEELH
jgi:hypothetical protein